MIPIQVEIEAGRKRESFSNFFDIPAIIGVGSETSWASSSIAPSGELQIPFKPVLCYSLADIENWFGDKVEGSELKGSNGRNYSLYTSALRIWGEGGELTNVPILCVQVDGTELTPTNVALAFDSIQTEVLSCVFLANYFEGQIEEDLIEQLKEFVETRGDCFGIYMLRYGKTTTGYLSDNLVAVAHKRLDSTIDMAAHFLGGILRRKPWQGGNYQVLSKVDFVNFSTQEVRELNANQINYPFRLNDGSIWMSENFVLGPLKFLDRKRIIDYASFRIQIFLNSSEVLGNLRINEAGLNSLEAKILSALGVLSDADVVNSVSVQIPALDAIKANDEESIQYYQNIRQVEVFVNLDLEDIIHQIKIYLTIT